MPTAPKSDAARSRSSRSVAKPLTFPASHSRAPTSTKPPAKPQRARRRPPGSGHAHCEHEVRLVGEMYPSLPDHNGELYFGKVRDKKKQRSSSVVAFPQPYHRGMQWHERLQILRTNAGMSQEDLAEMLDVRQATVSGWERNIRTPDIKTFDRLAQIFEVHPAFIIYGVQMGPTTGETLLGALSPADQAVVEQVARSLLGKTERDAS